MSECSECGWSADDSRAIACSHPCHWSESCEICGGDGWFTEDFGEKSFSFPCPLGCERKRPMPEDICAVQHWMSMVLTKADYDWAIEKELGKKAEEWRKNRGNPEPSPVQVRYESTIEKFRKMAHLVRRECLKQKAAVNTYDPTTIRLSRADFDKVREAYTTMLGDLRMYANQHNTHGDCDCATCDETIPEAMAALAILDAAQKETT